MTAEKIDYRYNAQERIKVALKDRETSNALVTAQIATAEAVLALVEQQRIANLIAYLSADVLGGGAGSAGAIRDIEKTLGLGR
jgi:hypothetical protein